MDALRVSVIHGPNLRLLGRREVAIYGDTTLEAINTLLSGLAEELGIELETFQSNHEGEILDYLEGVAGRAHGFLINAAGLTHSSVALRDGLVGVGRPFVEVHLSNLSARESFRQESLLSAVAAGVVYGFGAQSYLLGLRGLASHLRDTTRHGAHHD